MENPSTMENLTALTEEALNLIGNAGDLQSLDQVRVDYLGKKGQLTALLKSLGNLSAQERPAAGAKINEAKSRVQDRINLRKSELESAAVQQKLAAETIDVTLSGRRAGRGGYSGPSSGPRDARYLLYRCESCAAHSYLTCPGTNHASGKAADPGDLPRAGLPM